VESDVVAAPGKDVVTMASPLRAIVFDVDGTLYDQAPVRRAMFLRLMRFTLTHPAAGLRTLRMLRAYRKAQETLRHQSLGDDGMAAVQERLAAQAAGFTPDEVRACVSQWMERAPLDVLGEARRDGLMEALDAGRRRGLRFGVCSDYPAQAKLRALGLDTRFDVVVCAQDADVKRFKPDPRGLLVAASKLGVSPQETLYVGDRPDVDAVAADRAGMPSIILTSHTNTRRAGSSPAFYTCRALAEALDQEVL
jgi:HAD superfamily hydrolase (TIGR01509 family)